MNKGQDMCEKVQINGCVETYTLTTHRTPSEAQRKQGATTGNRRATTRGGGVHVAKTTAPRQMKITEYIDLRDGRAMQGEEEHAQQTKINPPHTQPALDHPQPNSHQPHTSPSHSNPNPARPTRSTISYHTTINPSHPNSSPSHPNPSTAQPNPAPTPLCPTSTACQPNPSISDPRQPNSNPIHSNIIPSHAMPTPTQPTQHPTHYTLTAHQPTPPPPCLNPCSTQPTTPPQYLAQPYLHPNLTHPNPTPPHLHPTPSYNNPIPSNSNPSQPIPIPNPNTTHFTPIPAQLISPLTQPSPSQHHYNPIQYHPSQNHLHLTPTPTPIQHTSHSPQSNSLNPTYSAHIIPNPTQLTQPQLNVTHAITFRGEEIAKLVACGIKYIENRNFSIGNGTLVAIAVGKKAADPKEMAALHTILTPHNPPVDLLTLTEPTMRGHIIGVCRISHTLAHDECRQSQNGLIHDGNTAT
jgi:hypothetical protein